ncbi:hypothetical protein BUALT_Bualt14G0044100 [Buddleja alternifolia]|uniref:Uncharacterized protein n=1 Tax=Buddleja alternifolia TaxID=168488 RepID=A0AAV6WI16_9LAMI|nr:hypothetical protein BUALT_Bualt14G0044100 [Buddleja alternifolia]
MSKNYDNWERLVRAVLRKDHDRQIALDHSWESSPISSSSSSFSSTSQFNDDQSLAKLHRRKLPMYHYGSKLDHAGWKAFLPPDEQEVVFSSISMCFFIDQRTGKNCFMLGSLNLLLSPMNESEICWNWAHCPNSS